MKIWAISDTHGLHEQLIVPEGIDMVIHAGDAANSKNRAVNSNEMTLFLLWYEKLPILHKIYVAGNHDTSVEAKMIKPEDFKGIIYLEHDYLGETNTEKSLLLFGSPYTPTFGEGWAFNKARHEISKYWDTIPNKMDILITHGPPKGILDLSYSRENKLEYCGDSALMKAVQRVKPKYHIFGHIHNVEDCYNQGLRAYRNTTFINASCIDNSGKRGLTSNGVIFEI